LEYACDVVKHPELTLECAFLTDVPPPEDDGSGGQAGQASTETPAGGASGE
jgi:hypothetical protein